MATITLRLDDETRNDVEALARGQGVTVSDLVRSAIDEILGREVTANPIGGPRSLTLVERNILVLQHEILAQLREDDHDEVENHLRIVKVLTEGFTGEYDSVFSSIDPEVPRRDCVLIWDLLNMFQVLKSSLSRLDDDDKAAIGEHAEHALAFRGFDFNDSREARLARYAKFVTGDGRWDELAESFDTNHESGNSHMPLLATYQRMLDAFEPIWKKKVSDYSMGPDSFLLNLDELRSVYTAWSNPRA
ncbi:MAG TPA: YfbU family protein [Acidimicrobiales bacterium]|jgi:hypothetical protein